MLKTITSPTTSRRYACAFTASRHVRVSYPLNSHALLSKVRWHSSNATGKRPAWLRRFERKTQPDPIESTRLLPSQYLKINYYSQAPPLLAYLGKHSERLPTDGYCSALAILLRVRHYAGAQEVVEAFFEYLLPRETFPMEALNLLLHFIFGQEFSKNMSVAAMDSMIGYILHKLRESHPKEIVGLTTLRLLLLHPSYISWTSLAKIKAMLRYPHLRPDIGEDGFLECVDGGNTVVQDHIYIMHGIMRAYSMHGADQMAQDWMHTITRALHLVTHAPRLSENVKLNEVALPALYAKEGDAQQPFRRTNYEQMLATTYMSSFGHRTGRFANNEDSDADDGLSGRLETDDEGLEQIESLDGDETAASQLAKPDKKRVGVDSSKAMAFFDQLRTMQAKAAAEGIEQLMGALDIYAWTSLLAVASRDKARVTAQALLGVFRRLQRESDLPDPNTVTYTVLLSGLTARGRADLAINIFRYDFLPAVGKEQLALDPHILQEYMSALTSEGQMEAAEEAMQCYAKRPRLDTAASAVAGRPARRANPLQASLQLDVHLLNRHMTALAKNGRYLTAYELYMWMESEYSVVPDEVTLSLLAKAAISRAIEQGRGNVPTHSEDGFKPSAAQGGDREMGKWGGRQPAAVVTQIYWSMLEQNFPLAKLAAEATVMSTAQRLLFGGPDPSAPGSPKTHALRDPAFHGDSRTDVEASDRRQQYPYLYPSPTNMHLLIALLGYFSASSQIPLVLAYMKELSIRPARKTLCLALWSFEEGGAMTGEMKRLWRWLADWLGHNAMPADDEIGMFRRKQWGS